MVVNEDEGYLDQRGALEFIASRLAPTEGKEPFCAFLDLWHSHTHGG
jgi:hypothetical protein